MAWETENAVAVTITGIGNINIPDDQTAKEGQVTITPTASGVYLLMAIGGIGRQPITKSVSIEVTPIENGEEG